MNEIIYNKDNSITLNYYRMTKEQQSVNPDTILARKNEIKKMFEDAGFSVKNMWQMANQYWPANWQCYHLREQNPWWAVKTRYGVIVIGPRKRVTVIDWSDCDCLVNVTKDNVTQTKTMVHAWNDEKIIEYLKSLQFTLSHQEI